MALTESSVLILCIYVLYIKYSPNRAFNVVLTGHRLLPPWPVAEECFLLCDPRTSEKLFGEPGNPAIWCKQTKPAQGVMLYYCLT
jgi:hypothetical protein